MRGQFAERRLNVGQDRGGGEGRLYVRREGQGAPGTRSRRGDRDGQHRGHCGRHLAPVRHVGGWGGRHQDPHGVSLYGGGQATDADYGQGSELESDS